jgi:hypothetical protein
VALPGTRDRHLRARIGRAAGLKVRGDGAALVHPANIVVDALAGIYLAMG